MLEYDLIKRMHGIMMKNEWQTRNAAENLYCPFCADESDRWENQYQHHDGCEFEKVRKIVENYLYLGKLNNDVKKLCEDIRPRREII